METRMSRLIYLALALFVASAVPATAQTNDADNAAADDIAAQIREEGYTCDDPVNAQSDPQASAPNETVWILSCKDDSYRVRLVPDMAADVEKID